MIDDSKIRLMQPTSFLGYQGRLGLNNFKSLINAKNLANVPTEKFTSDENVVMKDLEEEKTYQKFNNDFVRMEENDEQLAEWSL